MIELTTKRPMPTDEQVARWLLAHGWTETEPVSYQKPYIREFNRGEVEIHVPLNRPEHDAIIARQAMSDALSRVAYIHVMPGSLELYEEMTSTAEHQPRCRDCEWTGMYRCRECAAILTPDNMVAVPEEEPAVEDKDGDSDDCSAFTTERTFKDCDGCGWYRCRECGHFTNEEEDSIR